MSLHIALRWFAVAVLALAGWFPAPAFAQGAPAGDWAGPFVGAEAVGALDTVDTTESVAATGAVFHRFTAQASGAGGGANIGYNWLPAGGRLLFGTVASLDALSDSGGAVFHTSDDIVGSIALRGGFRTTPSLLWYAETGPAFTREDIKVDFGGPTTSERRTVSGYALGGGVEWALPAGFGPVAGTSLFVDYRHIWWANGTLATPAAEPNLAFRWQREANLMKAGFRVHF